MHSKWQIQLVLALDLLVVLVGPAGGQFQQAGPLQFLRPAAAAAAVASHRARTRSVESQEPVARLASSGKIREQQPARPIGGARPAAAQWRDAASSAPSSSRAGGVQSKCQKRSLGRVIKSARSLLTDGLEQYATRANLVLGSTLVAAAVPLVALVMPAAAPSQRMRAEANESAGLGAWGRRLASSLAAQGGVQARVDSVMGWIERSVEHLPNFPRLHPQECVKRSICEAHFEPERHGATGFLLRLLFPATNLSQVEEAQEGPELVEYKVTNKYRHAAGFGLARRLESQNGSSPTGAGVCREKYEDCVVSLLEVAQNLVDVFLR